MKLKILIVDDDTDSTGMLLKVMLRDYICVLIDCGKDAVDMCRRNKYDLILMNYSMPCMNGDYATEEIRKIDKNVIIFGNSAIEQYENRMIKSGCNEFFIKPVIKQELFKLISKYFNI